MIITEQVEKLTASLRSIRSLTSHARSKALKLTQLSQVCCRYKGCTEDRRICINFHQGDGSRKVDKASFVNSLKEEERKRLASELEEIERERYALIISCIGLA